MKIISSLKEIIYLNLRFLFRLKLLRNRNKSTYNFLFKRSKEANILLYLPDFYSISFLGGEDFFHSFMLYHHLEKDFFEDISIITKLPTNCKRKFIIFMPMYTSNHLRKQLITNNIIDKNSDLHPSEYYLNLSEYLSNNFYKSFPAFREVSFWENKIFMHSEFDRLNIKTPKSIFNVLKDANYNDLKRQLGSTFIMKNPRAAGSLGIFKISNENDLNNLKFSKNIQSHERRNNKNEIVIFQKLINMRKDLRVIIVKDQIVLHYWRINTSDKWHPTSTKHNSLVDYNNFPENHRDIILSTFKKLGITTGGFDICWEDDNIDNDPIFLEISTKYQPNPNPNGTMEESETYDQWRSKNLLSINDYFKLQLDETEKIQKLIANEVKRQIR